MTAKQTISTRQTYARLFAGLMCLTLMSNCAWVRDDFTRSGGLADRFGDKLMPVQHRKEQLYRATVAVSLLSAVGYRTVDRQEDAWDYVTSLQRVSDQLNAMHMLLDAPDTGLKANGTKDKDQCRDLLTTCNTYPVQFEDLLPDLEQRLFKLTVAVLPREKFEDVADDLVTGNYVGVALNLFRLTGTVLAAGHQAAANYRSSVTAIAYAMSEVDPTGITPKPPYLTVEAAREAVKDFFVRHGGTSAKPINPRTQDWDVLMTMARRYCWSAVRHIDDDRTEAEKRCREVVYEPVPPFSTTGDQPGDKRRAKFLRMIGGDTRS